MTVKGSWHRPHDKAKFDAGYDRIFGKQKAEDELRSDVLTKDSHLEEAADISDEMKLHGDKHVPWFLKEQAD